MSQNNVELTIPKKIGVYEDKKTKAQTVALPFKFLDGTPGVVMVTKLRGGKWKPTEDIVSIQINFND